MVAKDDEFTYNISDKSKAWLLQQHPKIATTEKTTIRLESFMYKQTCNLKKYHYSEGLAEAGGEKSQPSLAL